MAKIDDEPCCGAPAGPPSSHIERPGYQLWHFVEDLVETPVGPVPKVSTNLVMSDQMGAIRVRLGYKRNDYKVAPGLYCVGSPGPEDPVFVTANYKLSFDALRRELTGISGWILVLDTRGINVWCAAGKKTFSTEEVCRQVKATQLDKIIKHRELILPQLGAPGVSAFDVRKACRFKVIWGPVQANDIPEFIRAGKKAEPHMRRPTFTLADRLVLVPVELSLILSRTTVLVLFGIMLLSGIGTEIFSISAAWQRGLMAIAALFSGVIAGAVLTPALLPWIPGKQFALKGIILGLMAGYATIFLHKGNISTLEIAAMVLSAVAISSYAAMNFTGATPYTSPSGVEKEMRRFMPVQALAVLGAIIAWVAAPFI
ncbi:MAG: hypothetical protein KKE17_11210 [Proteobacteria bacterium]|nr:hypothetical protein [Pseudomonadota bacterium]MBU1710562.1 hypothetical protein [Pseudomonadota bacterium]